MKCQPGEKLLSEDETPAKRSPGSSNPQADPARQSAAAGVGEPALEQYRAFVDQLTAQLRKINPELEGKLAVKEIGGTVKRIEKQIATNHQRLGDLVVSLQSLDSTLQEVKEQVGTIAAAREANDNSKEMVKIPRALFYEIDQLRSRHAQMTGEHNGLIETVCQCLRDLDEFLRRRAESFTPRDLQSQRDVFLNRVGNHDLTSFCANPGDHFNAREHQAENGDHDHGRIKQTLLPGYRWKSGRGDRVILKAVVEVQTKE